MVDVAERTGSSIARVLRAWGMYGLIFILIAAFLINGEAVNIRPEIIMAYGILLIGFMKWYDIKVDDFVKEFGAKKKVWSKYFEKVNIPENSIVRGFVYYLAFFAFTWLILVIGLLIGIIPRGTIIPQNVLPTFLIQILVVSVIETLVFIVMLFIILKREFVDQAGIKLKYAIIPIIFISQLLFALFHWYAFAGSLFQMFLAFWIGVVFFIISWYFSPVAAMSTHVSYNLFVLGITSGGIVGISAPALTILLIPILLLILIGFIIHLIPKSIKNEFRIMLARYGKKYRINKDRSGIPYGTQAHGLGTVGIQRPGNNSIPKFNIKKISKVSV